jgi:uncharacterized protein YcfJ|tara:strand:- start:30 stop:506 length:477 start_codon:yes stop_codon:yes gene_type:complete
MYIGGKQMKNILLASSLIAATISTAASADQYNTKVWDVYTNQIVQTPKRVEGCHTVDVPIYKTVDVNGSAGDAIAGGVIGGVIGNQFGNGNGKDILTVLGVILGAKSADKTEQRIIGYNKVRRCTKDIVYENTTVKTYSHSVIAFTQDGVKQRLEFQK